VHKLDHGQSGRGRLVGDASQVAVLPGAYLIMVKWLVEKRRVELERLEALKYAN